MYDTVTNLSWAVDIRKHGIVNVIEEVLSHPWPPAVEAGREVPEAKPEEDCVVSRRSHEFALMLAVPGSYMGISAFAGVLQLGFWGLPAIAELGQDVRVGTAGCMY